MAKERIRLKEYEDLTFSDDFIFGKMMEDPELCRKVLETLLQRPVGELQNVVTQKMLKQTKDGKKIHLDVCTEDKFGIYDTEMQNLNKQTLKDLALAKRSRFYQGQIDVDYLGKGGAYRDLPDNNVIFICTFDPFEFGLPVYRFENREENKPELKLNDGTHKYFFNCTYTGNDIPKNLESFYHFIQKEEATDALTKELLGGVEKARHNEEWKSEYMKELLHDDDMIQEGIAIGREEEREKTLEIAVSLIKDGILSEEEATLRFGIDIEPLRQKLKESVN